MLDHAVVKVLAAQVRVARCRLDLAPQMDVSVSAIKPAVCGLTNIAMASPWYLRLQGIPQQQMRISARWPQDQDTPSYQALAVASLRTRACNNRNA